MENNLIYAEIIQVLWYHNEGSIIFFIKYLILRLGWSIQSSIVNTSQKIVDLLQQNMQKHTKWCSLCRTCRTNATQFAAKPCKVQKYKPKNVSYRAR